MRNLQQAAMTACNLFTCTNGGPHGCRHCRADLSYLLSVIGVGHANILEGLPEPTDALRLTREEWEREQAKPARPDPEDMSAEECETELKAAGTLVVWQSSAELWYVRCIANERQIAAATMYPSKQHALRAAVRALREHQAAQSRT